MDGTQGNSPQIIAESEGREFAADVRLHKGPVVTERPTWPGLSC